LSEKTVNMYKSDDLAMKKVNNILFFILAIFAIFYLGSSFLVPFIFGVFFASLTTPLSNLLEKFKVHRTISSLISTIVIFIVVGGLLYIFIHQINLFLSDIPSVRSEIQPILQKLQAKISSLTSLSPEQQKNIWQTRSEGILNTVESKLASFAGNVINSTLNFLLILVYVFLLLLYRDKLTNFLMMYVNHDKVQDAKLVLHKISKVVYQYLWGRAQVMALLGISYYITFLIFGLPYAVLLTIFGTLITIIPYIGPFISGLLPILFAIIFLEGFQTILLFTIIIVTIQLIESYVLEPLIIGKEVKLNPLIVIIAVIIGGLMWGIAGMILFVPIFAIVKIISNHTPGLEPIGYLFESSKKSSDGKK
jgi:predicted PurR-regulated permease PerM